MPNKNIKEMFQDRDQSIYGGMDIQQYQKEVNAQMENMKNTGSYRPKGYKIGGNESVGESESASSANSTNSSYRSGGTGSGFYKPTIENYAGETGKQIKDLSTKSDDSPSKSKGRMGLFNNYGKRVVIKKTLNEDTGVENRQKFVDGEEVKNRNKNKEYNKKKKVSRVGKGIVGRNK